MMAFSLQERDRRRRRKTWTRVFQIVAFFAMPVATFMVGYGVGLKLDDQRIANLEDTNAALELDARRLERERLELIQQARQSLTAAQEWQIRYERDVPVGERAALMALMDDTLAKGVTAERLGRFVEAAASERECGSPDTKRFLLGTDVNRGQAQSVSFDSGQITVSGQGTAARNGSNLPQGWFDPAQSVTMSFTKIGGDRDESAGVLPLHTSVLMGTSEVRFTIAVSDVRGYVDVTAAVCQ